MARPPKGSDLTLILKGLGRVGSAAIEIHGREITKAWANSSLKPLAERSVSSIQESIISPPTQIDVSKNLTEAVSRLSVVGESIKTYATAVRGLPVEERDFHPPDLKDETLGEGALGEIFKQPSPKSRDSNPTSDLHSKRVIEGVTGDGNIDGLHSLASLPGASEAHSIGQAASEAQNELLQRIQQLEPLETATVVAAPTGVVGEITDEQLQAIDSKVEELHGAGHVRDLKVKDAPLGEGTLGEIFNKSPKMGGNLSPSDILSERLMEGVTGEAELDSLQSVATLPGASTAHSIGQAASEAQNELLQRIQQLEPLETVSVAAAPTGVVGEITDEQLEALDSKLEELHGTEHMRDLKVKDEGTLNETPADILSKRVMEGVTGEAELDALQSVATLPGASTAHSIGQTASETQAELLQRIQELKPLETASVAAAPTGVVGEITNEQLEAIDSKLEELCGSEHRSDLKVLKEIEDTKAKTESAQHQAVRENISAIKSSDPISYGKINLDSLVHDTTPHPASAQTNVDTPKPAVTKSAPTPKLIGRKPLAKSKAKSTLSEDAQARKVPHSRFGRLLTFGSLAAGLGMGTIAEMTRRTLGVNDPQKTGALLDASPFLTEANARRIVDTLCKVRGAALKLGQMLSIQDNALINPQLQKIFERVRQSADFMPTWQLERTLIKDFGPDWKTLVASFDERPFAAASIGQVHQAMTHDGRSVAMKIQYPGVAEGIESDINNLVSTLSVANILPEGLYVESVIEVAKRELSWECDYEREKECTNRFRKLLTPHPEYYVPEVIDELCTKQVFTTELIEGISVDKCVSLDQETRNYIAGLVLKLCLMEVFQFGFMQTDPNWSNFFYNKDTQQLALVDFGACREYEKSFVDKYLNVIHGAATKDREKVREYSMALGFLTGYEAKVMIDAHVDTVMILGEAFQENRPFWFGGQNTTNRVQQMIPVMLSHRMCPPPEESYSLHRKMSGVFLLCAKLNASVNCQPMFNEIWNNYQFGGTWREKEGV